MDKSPLRKLPIELRYKIYKHVLTKPHRITLRATSCFRLLPWLLPVPIAYDEPAKILALTTVCRQLRVESIAVFLHENSFCVVTEIDKPLLRPGHPTFAIGITRAVHWSHSKVGRWLNGFRDDLYHFRNFEVELSHSEYGRFKRMLSIYRVCGAMFSRIQARFDVYLVLNLRVPCQHLESPPGLDDWFEIRLTTRGGDHAE